MISPTELKVVTLIFSIEVDVVVSLIEFKITELVLVVCLVKAFGDDVSGLLIMTNTIDVDEGATVRVHEHYKEFY